MSMLIVGSYFFAFLPYKLNQDESNKSVKVTASENAQLLKGGADKECAGMKTVVVPVVEPSVDTEVREPDGLYAQSAVLLDADSGRVLFEKNGIQERPMASTTKIMTCILALEYGNLDDVVTASNYAANQPKVHLGVVEGEQVILRDLLYSLMLESHNDAAVMIAEQIGGSVEGFADLMNQKAKSIGCENTYFITPNGLDDSDENGVHRTTAEDLARIMKYCIQDSSQTKQFLSICQTKTYEFEDCSHVYKYSCYNHNTLLQMMEGTIAGKTGFTNEAGYCYVGAVEQGGKKLIVALLACGWPNHKGYKWSDTKVLMNYGFESFEYAGLNDDEIEEQLKNCRIPVENGVPNKGKISGVSSVGIQLKQEQKNNAVNCDDTEHVLIRKDQGVNAKIRISTTLRAPVMKENELGEVQYFLNETVIKRKKLITKEAVQEKNYKWCVLKVQRIFLL